MAARPGSSFRNYTRGKARSSCAQFSLPQKIGLVSGKCAVTATLRIPGRKIGFLNCATGAGRISILDAGLRLFLESKALSHGVSLKRAPEFHMNKITKLLVAAALFSFGGCHLVGIKGN